MDPKKYQELLDSVAQTEYSDDAGGPVIKKLLPKPQVCARPNCGHIVTDDLVLSVYYERPLPHWRSNCKTCLCYLNPYTGEPLQGSKAQTVNTVNSIVRQHYRQRELAQGIQRPRRYQRKNPEPVIQQEDNVTKITTEHDAVTITEYIYTSDK